MRSRVETLSADGPLSHARGVVICDGEPIFARGLARLLESANLGFHVLGVVMSNADLEEIAGRTQPDLAILDGRFGLQSLQRVRAVSPGTRMVVLVDDDQEMDVLAALRVGLNGCLIRQSELDEILEALRVVLRGHVVVHAALAQAGRVFSGSGESALTTMERQILEGIARGENNSEIAARLHLSERTVRRRVVDLYAKLQLGDRIQAALYAVRCGLSTGDFAASRRPSPVTSRSRNRLGSGEP